MQKIIQENHEVLNERDESYCDPLTFAAIAGNLEIMKYLLSQGADINTIDRENSNLMHNAAANGYLEVVKYLIDQSLTLMLLMIMGTLHFSLLQIEIISSLSGIFLIKEPMSMQKVVMVRQLF